jgi:hypothetical protein
MSMVAKTREELEFEYSRVDLKKMTTRVRSTRPLVHQVPSYTITQLKEWGLLYIGQTNRHDFDDEHSLVTTLADKRTVLKIRWKKVELVLALVSRPLGKGLVWYFQDPVSRRLFKSVHYSKEGFKYGAKAAGLLYASQFQSKCHRQLLRMDQLIRDIDGDWNDRIGPARGESKLRKLRDLSRIFSEVRAANHQIEVVLAKIPQLYMTICAANLLLKRELGKSHKSWVPPAQQPKRRGHYSMSGLYVIPK